VDEFTHPAHESRLTLRGGLEVFARPAGAIDFQGFVSWGLGVDGDVKQQPLRMKMETILSNRELQVILMEIKIGRQHNLRLESV